MPVYLYQHPNTEEIIEVTQKISDNHSYTDDKGVEWNRVFTVPHASIPMMNRIDANSEQDFLRRTESTGGTMGDLFDLSQELSEKRKSERGDSVDPVKQKFYKNYSKKRNGMKHPDDKPSPKYKPNSDGVIEI